MNQSKSKLLNYISLLLSDDEALQRFLIDPITDAEGKYGITKAERAVLRRTVFHLSNRSLNGYTLVRHLGSYRRSLRLLQNVLHNVGSKMAQETHVAATAPAQGEAADPTPMNTYTLVYYYPNTGGTDFVFTGMNNDQVQANYGGAYSQSVSYTLTTSLANLTIFNLMEYAAGNGPPQPNQPLTKYTLDTSQQFLTALTLPNGTTPFTITGDPTDPRYSGNPDANFVFWFWSINGTPRPSYVGDVGKDGESFRDQLLSPNDTVYWQLIAPDSTYGFQPCTVTPHNAFAEAAKASRT